MIQLNSNKLTQHCTINSKTSSNPANREPLNPFTTQITFSQQGLRLTLTCIHVASIVFVSIRVPRTDGEIEQVVCESITVETNIVPSAVTDDCGAGWDTRIHDGVSVEQSVTSARQVSPIAALHQQSPTLLCITCCNYTCTCGSRHHPFPQICRHAAQQPPLK